jgi:hypothetical protein
MLCVRLNESYLTGIVAQFPQTAAFPIFWSIPGKAREGNDFQGEGGKRVTTAREKGKEERWKQSGKVLFSKPGSGGTRCHERSFKRCVTVKPCVIKTEKLYHRKRQNFDC